MKTPVPNFTQIRQHGFSLPFTRYSSIFVTSTSEMHRPHTIMTQIRASNVVFKSMLRVDKLLRVLRRGLPGLFAIGLAEKPASAETTFPSRPITLIVPFAAGGPANIIARLLTCRLTPAPGRPIIVENVVAEPRTEDCSSNETCAIFPDLPTAAGAGK